MSEFDSRGHIHTPHDEIPEGTFGAELNEAQIGAIKLSIQTGQKIQIDFPQIADDYRKGFSLSELVVKHRIMEAYGIKNPKTAAVSISLALRGYDGNIKVAGSEKPYSGLIKDPGELARIGRDHNSESSRNLDQRRRKDGAGFYGIPLQQRVETGTKSGKKTYELGIGIHAQTPKERRDVGRLVAIEQGNVPYSDDEIRAIFELTGRSEFKRKSQIDAKKIADTINQQIHGGNPVRKPRDITKVYTRYKNKFGKEEEGW